MPPASPGVSPRSAGGSGPSFFQITTSAMHPVACEILCGSFKSEVSISCSPLALMKVSLSGLHSQMFGVCFSVVGLLTMESNVGFVPIPPWGKHLKL